MRVLVCGSRDWDDEEYVHDVLDRFYSGAKTVIHGDCRGPDRFGGSWAKSRDKEERSYPANWEVYGKSAGMIRNAQMLKIEEPDVVVAFVEDLESSPGTRSMISLAKKAGVKTRVYEKDKRDDD